MREQALAAARLDRRDLETLDAGAGTGFTTEGIVAQVDPQRVTMLDQSPHQLARAARRPALAGVRRLLGDAEALPFADDAFDRYVSAGSIEYWPDPQRGIAEAYRVLRDGGVGVVIGPVRPAGRIVRALADVWMLFPADAEYRDVVRARGLRGRAGGPGGARLVPRHARALRRRRQRRRKPAPGRRRSRSPPPSRSCAAPLHAADALRVGAALRRRLAGRPGVRADRARDDAAGAPGAPVTSHAAAVAPRAARSACCGASRARTR